MRILNSITRGGKLVERMMRAVLGRRRTQLIALADQDNFSMLSSTPVAGDRIAGRKEEKVFLNEF